MSNILNYIEKKIDKIDPSILEWLQEVFKDEYYDIPEYQETPQKINSDEK